MMDRNILLVASLASMTLAVNLHQYINRNTGFIPEFGGHGYSTSSVDYGSIYKARKNNRRAKNRRAKNRRTRR